MGLAGVNTSQGLRVSSLPVIGGLGGKGLFGAPLTQDMVGEHWPCPQLSPGDLGSYNAAMKL